jgi:hypothetical protein
MKRRITRLRGIYRREDGEYEKVNHNIEGDTGGD